MFHDSESHVGNERALANDALHDLDLTGQLALPRPMLVARVGRPGSRLILDNAPSPPKVDQTTLVRVILPLETRPRVSAASGYPAPAGAYSRRRLADRPPIRHEDQPR